jgi:hypothetical protein
MNRFERICLTPWDDGAPRLAPWLLAVVGILIAVWAGG